MKYSSQWCKKVISKLPGSAPLSGFAPTWSGFHLDPSFHQVSWKTVCWKVPVALNVSWRCFQGTSNIPTLLQRLFFLLETQSDVVSITISWSTHQYKWKRQNLKEEQRTVFAQKSKAKLFRRKLFCSLQHFPPACPQLVALLTVWRHWSLRVSPLQKFPAIKLFNVHWKVKFHNSSISDLKLSLVQKTDRSYFLSLLLRSPSKWPKVNIFNLWWNHHETEDEDQSLNLKTSSIWIRR